MKFKTISNLVRSTIAAACLLVGTHLSQAISYQVTVDTSSLIADPGAPFALDFQLTGGNPLANSITVSNFNFGSGYATDNPLTFTLGGVTGDLSSTVTLSTTQ